MCVQTKLSCDVLPSVVVYLLAAHSIRGQPNVPVPLQNHPVLCDAHDTLDYSDPGLHDPRKRCSEPDVSANKFSFTCVIMQFRRCLVWSGALGLQQGETVDALGG